MLQTVPIVWISSGPGLSRVASCCAERKMRLPRASACSSARIELFRPTTNGIIMCGNTTRSRIGTIGRFSIEIGLVTPEHVLAPAVGGARPRPRWRRLLR